MAFWLKKKKEEKLEKIFIHHKHIPKYAWFYGKEHQELLNKMNLYEKAKAKRMGKDIIFNISATSAPAFMPLVYKQPLASAGFVPVQIVATKYLKREILKRRAFLEEKAIKYGMDVEE